MQTSARPELHLQRLEAAQHHPGFPGGRLVGWCHPGEAPDQLRQRHLCLEAGEGRAEAVVGAAAEGGVLVRPRAGQFEDVDRMPPLLRITVGGTQTEEEDHPGAISVSSSSIGSTAMRLENCTGESKRMNSSIALVSSEGFDRRRSS